MPYLANIPQPGTLLSQSQVDILNNFQALNNVYLGINNYITLPEQGASPAAGANQMSIYTKAVGGVTSLFILPETGAGAERDITTAGKTASGWYLLPSGILVKWFHVPAVTNHTVYAYPVAAGTPVFSAVYHAQVTTEYTGTALNYPVCFQAFTATNITLATKNGAGDSGAYITITGIPV